MGASFAGAPTSFAPSARDRQEHLALVGASLRRPLAFRRRSRLRRRCRSRGRLSGGRLRRFLFRLVDALLQRRHQVGAGDDPRHRALLGDWHPRPLLVQHYDDRLLVAIVEFRGIERRRLAVEYVLGESQHVLRDLNLADVAEIDPLVPNLIRVPERRAEQTLPPRLQHDHALALGQDDPAQRDHVLVLHGVADHRERLEGDLVLRNQVIRAVDVALVDFRFRHEAVDVDRVAALDRDCVKLLVLDAQVDPLVDFVAPPLVVRVDRLARLFVDELLAKAIARLLVDLPKRDALARRRRRVERDRA